MHGAIRLRQRDQDMETSILFADKVRISTITVIVLYVRQLTRDNCAFVTQFSAFSELLEDARCDVEPTLSADLFVFELEAYSYQRAFQNSRQYSRLVVNILCRRL